MCCLCLCLRYSVYIYIYICALYFVPSFKQVFKSLKHTFKPRVVLVGVLSSPAGFLSKSLQALLFHSFCALDYDPLPQASTTNPGHSSCCDGSKDTHSRLQEQSFGKVFEGVRAKGGGALVLLSHHHGSLTF